MSLSFSSGFCESISKACTRHLYFEFVLVFNAIINSEIHFLIDIFFIFQLSFYSLLWVFGLFFTSVCFLLITSLIWFHKVYL
jgi:hypothetical protein